MALYDLLRIVFGPIGLAQNFAYDISTFTTPFYILIGFLAMYWVLYVVKGTVLRGLLAIASMVFAFVLIQLFGVPISIITFSLEPSSLWPEALLVALDVGVSVFLAGLLTNYIFGRYFQQGKKVKKKA